MRQQVNMEVRVAKARRYFVFDYLPDDPDVFEWRKPTVTMCNYVYKFDMWKIWVDTGRYMSLRRVVTVASRSVLLE